MRLDARTEFKILEPLLKGGVEAGRVRSCTAIVVFMAWLIARLARTSRVQPATHQYSSISTAPPLLSCGYTRIKGRPLIKPLIGRDYEVNKGPSVYKKVLSVTDTCSLYYGVCGLG